MNTLLLFQIDPSTRHVSLVVCPLRSLMADQARRWGSCGVATVVLTKESEMDEKTMQGICKL